MKDYLFHSQVRKLKNRKVKNLPKVTHGLSNRAGIIPEVSPPSCSLTLLTFSLSTKTAFMSLPWGTLVELSNYPVLWVTHLFSVSQVFFPFSLPTPNLEQDSSLLRSPLPVFPATMFSTRTQDSLQRSFDHYYVYLFTYFILWEVFFLAFFYCCSSTLVSIFIPPLLPTPRIPASYPRIHPLWLCPWALYACS